MLRRFVWIFIALAVVISLPTHKAVEPTVSDYYALWEKTGTQNYQVVIDVIAPPAPQRDFKLTVRDGQITQTSILACDQPSDEYPATSCEPIRSYYADTSFLTIEPLFERVNNCTLTTEAAFAACPTFAQNHDFASVDDLYREAQTCADYIKPSTLICVVEFDPKFGYPKSISSYIPGTFDSFSRITVKAFTPQ